MNNKSISPTEGVLIIEMPGRGVSLQRVGKSRTKCGHREGKTKFVATAGNSETIQPRMDYRPTVMRAGGEITREIEMHQSVCHQQCKVSADVAEHWANHPRPDEWVKKQFVPKYKPGQRFAIALEEHFEAICIAANLRPDRCSWRFDAL